MLMVIPVFLICRLYCDIATLVAKHDLRGAYEIFISNIDISNTDKCCVC